MKLKSVKKDGINEFSYIVVDDQGIPIDKISRFTVLENDGKSDSYQESIARTVIHIENWANKYVSLEDEMNDGCLSDGELFTSFIRHLERYADDIGDVIHISPRIVQPEYFNQRIDVAIKYLDYYANKALSKRRTDAQQTKNLKERSEKLYEKLSDKKRPISNTSDVKGLSLLAQASLYKGLDEPKLFRWNNYTRLRNKLIIRLFYETGIRKGELLSLTIENCHTSKLKKQERPYIHTMENVKYHDPRTKIPHEKTRNRIVPISLDLAELINEYKLVRSESKEAKKQPPFLFLSSHNPHPPISLSGLDGVFDTIKEHLPDIDKLGPHRLRHTFFENLDRMMYLKGYTDVFKTKIKNSIGGWSPKSKTSENYEKLATEEQCYDVLNKLHSELEREIERNYLEDVPF